MYPPSNRCVRHGINYLVMDIEAIHRAADWPRGFENWAKQFILVRRERFLVNRNITRLCASLWPLLLRLGLDIILHRLAMIIAGWHACFFAFWSCSAGSGLVGIVGTFMIAALEDGKFWIFFPRGIITSNQLQSIIPFGFLLFSNPTKAWEKLASLLFKLEACDRSNAYQ